MHCIHPMSPLAIVTPVALVRINNCIATGNESQRSRMCAPEWVWHGTTADRIVSICRDGLRPGSDSNNTNDAGYFGDSKQGDQPLVHVVGLAPIVSTNRHLVARESSSSHVCLHECRLN